jgi:hypothetical protein
VWSLPLQEALKRNAANVSKKIALTRTILPHCGSGTDKYIAVEIRVGNQTFIYVQAIAAMPTPSKTQITAQKKWSRNSNLWKTG